MRKRFDISVLVLGCTLVSAARAVDKEKLRAAVELPHVAMMGGVGFSSLGDFVFMGEQTDHTAEIARLHKAMQDNPSDAERWQRLADLYDAQGNKAQSEKAERKAIALYRERLKVHPRDGVTLAHLGATLHLDDHATEAERLLRQAVQEAPTQSECWLELGDFLSSRAWYVFTDGKSANKDFGEVLALVMAHPPTPEKVAQTRKLLDEAGACFDKGVSLAHAKADAYFRRACFRATSGFLRGVLDLADGKLVNPMLGMMNPEAAADLRQVARLRPNDYKARGAAALIAILAATLHADHPVEKPEDMLKLLSPQDQKAIRADVKRLEELTRSNDSVVAAGSMQTLGMLYMIGFGNMNRATLMYHKLVALQPRNEQAWELLQACLVAQKNTKELLAVCKQRVKAKASARGRVLLAKAYAQQKQWDKAEKEIEAARKLDAKDYLAALAWAAVRTRASRDPAGLDAAKAAVANAHELLPAKASLQERTEGQSIAAIYQALAGDADSARKNLEEVLQKDPNQEMAKHALQALDAKPGNDR